MRRLAFLLLLAPAVALADGGGMPAPPTSGSPSWNQSSSVSKEDADKMKAADLYAQAYREIDKAKAELADAKTLAKTDAKKSDAKKASAQKRLEKSRDRLVESTKLDATNADAWNMLGFSRRNTGDHKGAFDAYWKCLSLKPEHIGAHEYMGEAYLEEGKIDEAKKELAWLKTKGNMATMETSNLTAAIDEWVAANPAAATPTPAAVGAGTPATTAAASPDSTAK